MAVTEAFLASCRTAIEASPELAAFRTAYAAFDAAPRSSKGRYWRAAFDDAQAGLSPAYRVKKLVRETVQALADGTVTAMERETAYRTLAGQYAPSVREPQSTTEVAAELQRVIQEDRVK